MKREIRTTSDGSTTIYLPDWDEQYHSKHGAVAEANHVFIKNGLHTILTTNITVLEIGFGTGLNCFLSFLEAQKKNLQINYVGLEAYPITDEELLKMNYVSVLKAQQNEQFFKKLHTISWEIPQQISNNFTLIKRNQLFENFNEKNKYNLIYFDAFAPRHQPELWTENIFKKMFIALKYNGILVTYSAKGSVRRAMQTVGFIVQRLPGPPGKREMLRAIKTMID